MSQLHLSEDFNSDGYVHEQEGQSLKVLVALGLFGDFIQVVQILLALVLGGQLMEGTDQVADLSLGLLDRLDLDGFLLVVFGQVELGLPLLLLLLLLHLLSVFLGNVLRLLSAFVIVPALLAHLLLQEVLSSDHDILRAPVASVLALLVRFLLTL